MGNNPSRTTHHHHHTQQSASSSASASPPTRSATTTASSRRPSYRRNSLQSPASTKYGVATSQEFLTPARPQPPSSHDHHGHHGGGSQHHSRYHTPPPGPQRRESIATAIPEGAGYHAFPTRTREELIEDAATLRLFPNPPIGVNVQPASPSPFLPNANPFAPNVNPFAAPAGNTAGRHEMPLAPGMRQGRGSMESTAASLEEEALASQECDDARAVPTLIQWPYPGTKVYVTGTFCAWEKRYRLTRKYVSLNIPTPANWRIE